MASWNPWKVIALALTVVVATALVTGLVVANWSGIEADKRFAADAGAPAAKPVPAVPAKRAPVRVASAPVPAAPAPRVTQTPPAAPAVPTQEAVDACNRVATSQTGQHDKTMEVVKDAAVGALLGAAVGAAGGAIAGGGKGAGKGAAIGGVVGAGGGTLYGLNENKKQDERYREAYANCMRSRGYSG